MTNQSDLAPGQSLVSRAGAIWRWDGYTIRAGTPTQAAVRLQQRNRLIGLRTRLAAAEQEAAAARHGAGRRPKPRRRRRPPPNSAAAMARREAEQKLERARAGLASLRNQAATATARLAAADEQLSRITVERDEAVAALAQAREAHAALPDLAELRAAVDRARAALSAVRSRESAARSRTRHAGARACRPGQSPPGDRRRTRRLGRAVARTPPIGSPTWPRAKPRRNDALQSAGSAPAEIAARRAEALDALEAAEATHRRRRRR